jgi:hypothetical protein
MNDWRELPFTVIQNAMVEAEGVRFDIGYYMLLGKIPVRCTGIPMQQ